MTSHPHSWKDALHAELAALNRWCEGRYVLEPDPNHEVIPATRYADPGFLLTAINRTRAAGTHASSDLVDEKNKLSVAVSRFTRQYCATLVLAAAAGLARGVGLDLSPQHCNMVIVADLPFRATLDVPDDGIVRCTERPSPWPLGDGPSVETMSELRSFVWQKLYGEHLVPLFDRIHALTRVSHNVVWTNAAEWWAMISDAAVEYLGDGAARPFIEERTAIFEAASLPGVDGPNPLARRIDWEFTAHEGYLREIQLRHTCCICYRFDDRLGRLCGNCPFLDIEDRVALVRERHDVAQGKPGGPAEERAIAVGLEKLRLESTRPR